MHCFLFKPPIKKNNKVKIKGEEKIYTKNKKEDYFDKFRNKDKLKTKAERLLERDGKKKKEMNYLYLKNLELQK